MDFLKGEAPGKDDFKPRPCLDKKMPLINNAFTRATGSWMTWQRGPCAQFEYNWNLCAERVGAREVGVACKKFHDDFIECALKFKSRARHEAMQEERKKQNKPYLPPPEPDSIRIYERDHTD